MTEKPNRLFQRHIPQSGFMLVRYTQHWSRERERAFRLSLYHAFAPCRGPSLRLRMTPLHCPAMSNHLSMLAETFP